MGLMDFVGLGFKEGGFELISALERKRTVLFLIALKVLSERVRIMLAKLNLISLILSCLHLEVKLTHLSVPYHLILPLSLLSHVSLILLYLFLQRR